MPMRRNTWFTVSATECAASANIAALPVSAAATNLAQAMRKFAAIAARTAARLSSPGCSTECGSARCACSVIGFEK